MRPRIRIASYNIHGGLGCDGHVVPKRIARVIAELNPDVIALQEVESRATGFDMLNYLSNETGMEGIAGPTLLKATGDYGNGLLIRHRAVEVRRLDLSIDRHEPRGALDVELDCNGWPLRVLATHLGLFPDERRRQTKMLLCALEDQRPVATVLMGDLNEWWLWGRPLRWLHAHFREAPSPSTFPSRFPCLALDRIWIKPRRLLRRLAVHRTPLSRIASDHLPVMAEVECGTVQPGEIDSRGRVGAE
ncbi:MAG TPA: endonuclease/exonuclease/phosphatase family protein [Burkholderiales bacterium]|nr:endonuclease/exonuclease/phosphatase family protein [Burkholderiales bacterium]